MDWETRKELKAKREKVMKEYWQIVDPENEGTIRSKNVFIRELEELCNYSDSFVLASSRLEHYCDKAEQDKKVVQDLEDELLDSEVDFYSAFVAFAKKFSSESSRVHSAMGSKTSELKKKTSAENGKKGGRPRKSH